MGASFISAKGCHTPVNVPNLRYDTALFRGGGCSFLSDLERSTQVTQVFNGLYPNLFKITTELLLMMDRKSCMRFHLAPLSLTPSGLDRSNRGQAYFKGP